MKEKHKIVMLSTNKKSNIHLTIKKNFLYQSINCFTQENKINFDSKHLYITSDKEIEKGDWYITNYVNEPNEVERNKIIKSKNNKKLHYKYSKIIATTDISLNIPLIPQSFIEKYIKEYNKSNIITEVNVEYQEILDMSIVENTNKTINILKVDTNNIINIYSIKDSWNREEVKAIIIDLQNKAYVYGANSSRIENYIKEKYSEFL